ncbi:hypothetical protein [Acinetobacter pittii]|uniref:hypothetical protein n=1 Tax=Acinetobacter pittii TaxID=48296 RepID=UPI0012D83771|nr:hypothetical protein [Acinetobacter pittii]
MKLILQTYHSVGMLYSYFFEVNYLFLAGGIFTTRQNSWVERSCDVILNIVKS